MPNRPEPPVAPRRPAALRAHGVSWTDEYAWLRAENWREVLQDPCALPPAIRAHLKAETDYAEARLAPAAALQADLIAEMRGRIEDEDASPPEPDGDYLYVVKYRAGGEHPLYCRAPRRSPEAAEILLDGDELANGRAYFDLGAVSHSRDHARLLYAVDDQGSEFYDLFVRDLRSGADLDFRIPATAGDAVWANDAETIFYVVRDENLRPNRVLKIAVGDARPREVYTEPDPAFSLGLDVTSDERFIVIAAHASETSEARVIDADDPTAPPRVIAPRETGVEYDVDHGHGRFYIRTNADGAEDFKIAVMDDGASGRASWRDWRPAEPGVLRLDLAVYANHVVRLERRDALPRLVITELAGDTDREIAFEDAAYALSLDPGYEFDTTRLRFGYETPAKPEEIYDYDMATHDRVLIKRQKVPSGHRPEDYVVERLEAPAADGARVPVTVLRRRDTPLDGSAPLFLYGYGSYGATIPAAFSTARLSLVDRGFIYAIAHVRGGMARGYAWYRAGKLQNKINTFTDYLATARFLCAQGYGAEGRIVAHGGSAGGLLVGAALNMAPELFAGAIADVPFVDVLATMLDAELPLTPPEWTEWGDPISDKSAFEAIRAYSPYDNVAARAYPPILATSGLSDPRVTYWEPAKWVQRLRARTLGDPAILLHVNMDAGHAGRTGRYDGLTETARLYAFALMAISGGFSQDPSSADGGAGA